jgi:hypothetical protein
VHATVANLRGGSTITRQLAACFPEVDPRSRPPSGLITALAGATYSQDGNPPEAYLNTVPFLYNTWHRMAARAYFDISPRRALEHPGKRLVGMLKGPEPLQSCGNPERSPAAAQCGAGARCAYAVSSTGRALHKQLLKALTACISNARRAG